MKERIGTMRIETLEVSGFASAIKAVYLSYNKSCKSSINVDCRTFGEDMVASQYAGALATHTEVLFDKEMKDIKLLSTLVKRGPSHAKPLRGIVVHADITAPIYFWYELETYCVGHQRLMSESTMHSEGRGLAGAELQKVKSEITMGHPHRKIDMFSYQCLRTIVQQRTGHRLPEWAEFIEWIHTLPFADELIFAGLETDTK